jgi:uncharacterized protein
VALGNAWRTALQLSVTHSGLAGLVFVSPQDVPRQWSPSSTPLLVIAGGRDPLLEQLAPALRGTVAVLERIDGADAQFDRNLPQVGRAVASWVERLTAP